MCGALACEDVSEDILFLSPSVKRERFKNSGGVILSSDYELFLSECKKPIFAVTGSDGKSSTARILTMLLSESAPNAQFVHYTFPQRDNMPKVGMPEVDVYWYDGGLLPERPAGLAPGKNLNDAGGAAIFYGTKDTLICGCYGRNPYLVSGRVPNAPKVCREVKGNYAHQQDWIRACKESPENRVLTESDFSVAGPFNEMVVMGVLAVRLQSLNRVLEWDGENMRFTNIPADATIRSIIKDGFSIKDGHPTFNKTWTEPVNANEFAQELIKHTYRDGWKLPDMPKF